MWRRTIFVVKAGFRRIFDQRSIRERYLANFVLEVELPARTPGRSKEKRWRIVIIGGPLGKSFQLRGERICVTGDNSYLVAIMRWFVNKKHWRTLSFSELLKLPISDRMEELFLFFGSCSNVPVTHTNNNKEGSHVTSDTSKRAYSEASIFSSSRARPQVLIQIWVSGSSYFLSQLLRWLHHSVMSLLGSWNFEVRVSSGFHGTEVNFSYDIIFGLGNKANVRLYSKYCTWIQRSVMKALK